MQVLNPVAMLASLAIAAGGVPAAQEKVEATLTPAKRILLYGNRADRRALLRSMGKGMIKAYRYFARFHEGPQPYRKPVE